MSRRGSNIYHRKDGRWEGRYYMPGTTKYKSVYGKSYTEVKERLGKLRSKVLVPSTRCILMVVDILKMWLETHRSSIKESSYGIYRHKLEKHLVPYFCELKYSKLDLNRVNAFIADKFAEGLSPKYIADMVIMIKTAAKWAEINHNYANLVRNAELPKKKSKETPTFTPAEQKKIISTVQSEHSNTGCGVMLMLFTGMRIGEVCALKWADIDFDIKVLHVTKTLQRVSTFGEKSKTAVKITAPKSASSVRDIPLPDFIINMLKEYRADDDEFILSGTEKFVEPRCFSNRYKALLKRAGVRALKPHATRHTFATNAIQQDFDVKTLSELLGHSNANVTMSVYVHTSMERKCACMERMQALI